MFFHLKVLRERVQDDPLAAYEPQIRAHWITGSGLKVSSLIGRQGERVRVSGSLLTLILVQYFFECSQFRALGP